MQEDEVIKYDYTNLFSTKNKMKIRKLFDYIGIRDDLFLKHLKSKHISLSIFREKILQNNISYNNRRDFPKDVKTDVADRANSICSKCGSTTRYPFKNNTSGSANMGIIAHIYPALNTGPRGTYWATSGKSINFLDSIENAIFVCCNCSAIIDSNLGQEFTPADLFQMKEAHEEKIRQGKKILEEENVKSKVYYSQLKEDEARNLYELECLVKSDFEIVEKFNNPAKIAVKIENRRVFGLSIPSKKLKKIFEEILQFKDLQFISLNNNELSDFDTLCEISSLKEVYLNSNKIEKIPDTVIKLKDLRILELKENRIGEINTQILLSEKVIRLNLSQNKISEVPKEIFMLSRLSYLILNNNNIKEIPKMIQESTSLKEIDIRNNSLNNDIIQYLQEIQKKGKIKIRYDEHSDITNYYRQIPKEFHELDDTNYDLRKITDHDILKMITFNDVCQQLKIKRNELKQILNLESKNFYKTHVIPKKRGHGNRILRILDEKSGLHKAQYMILTYILLKINPSEYAFGFIKGSSHLLNAEQHLDSEILIKMDFKDFFTSIKFSHVYDLFKSLGYSNMISAYLSIILCYSNQNEMPFVPQGTQASPYLSNLICLKMDEELATTCEKSGFRYSRYGDDLTFSTKAKKIPHGFFSSIYKIIHHNGFMVNTQKLRIENRYNRQLVTGILVNHKDLRLPRRYLNDLRRKLFELEFKINENDELIERYRHLQGVCGYISSINPSYYKKYAKELKRIKLKREIQIDDYYDESGYDNSDPGDYYDQSDYYDPSDYHDGYG